MMPREGLFKRIFSVLAEIRYQNNSTKLEDISPVRPPLLKRPRERKEAVPQVHGTVLQATFMIQKGS